MVFGIGNDIITDDAIGPKLTKRLKKNLNLPDIDYETAFVGGLDILEYIKNYKKVIFIDAIKTKNGIPGDVYQFSVDNFNETHNLSNIHDISFLTALKLGEEIGYTMPEEIQIIAIEIKVDMVYSDSFSPEIESRYDEIYSKVKNHLIECISGITDNLR
ncbi:MAG: hydrogenase maturation protease [Chloroflexia bacterium]|nr:hydrogenase maturation protease [Chloroflexia bacterium]